MSALRYPNGTVEQIRTALWATEAVDKAIPRKVKILERAETMGDVPHAPNGFGKTLRVQFWTV